MERAVPAPLAFAAFLKALSRPQPNQDGVWALRMAGGGGRKPRGQLWTQDRCARLLVRGRGWGCLGGWHTGPLQSGWHIRRAWLLPPTWPAKAGALLRPRGWGSWQQAPLSSPPRPLRLGLQGADSLCVLPFVPVPNLLQAGSGVQ